MKRIIVLNESDIRRMAKKSVKEILHEQANQQNMQENPVLKRVEFFKGRSYIDNNLGVSKFLKGYYRCVKNQSDQNGIQLMQNAMQNAMRWKDSSPTAVQIIKDYQTLMSYFSNAQPQGYQQNQSNAQPQGYQQNQSNAQPQIERNQSHVYEKPSYMSTEEFEERVEQWNAGHPDDKYHMQQDYRTGKMYVMPISINITNGNYQNNGTIH